LKVGLERKQRGDMVGAVAAFEAYRQRHPRGAFLGEAAVAEVEALLASGREAQARVLLERMGDDPKLPRSAELRLLRAELAARAGRCTEALPVFDGALESPALAERALYGRASCLQAQGELDESRRAFELYLVRFPKGKQADDVRRALHPSRKVFPR
jgi:tetratricopeptide (TPR) repeat protein